MEKRYRVQNEPVIFEADIRMEDGGEGGTVEFLTRSYYFLNMTAVEIDERVVRNTSHIDKFLHIRRALPPLPFNLLSKFSCSLLEKKI